MVKAFKQCCEEFQNPSGEHRPRMRWWIPGASLSMEGIEADLCSMAEAGFGGAEVVPMPRFDTKDDVTIEWGTGRFKAFCKHMLETAARCHMTIDFSMTPFWPLALPGITDAADPCQGAQLEADAACIDGITIQTPFCGVLPMSKEALADAGAVCALPRLAGVSVAKYQDKEKKILSYDSAKSLTLGVDVIQDSEDCLVWCASFTPPEEGEYVLFAWWEHPSGEKTCQNVQLDHFGKAAAARLTSYWKDEFLTYFGERFNHAAAFFIDSLEFQTHLDWTDGFLEKFREAYGYDFTPYLPAVYDEDSVGCFVSFPEPDFSFDKHNKQLIHDFYRFLTTLYIDNHLKPLTAFANEHGVNMRYQTAYGKSLELARTAMYVSIPETETLYGADILDFYRLQAGAAHLSRKQLYSIEASAEMNGRGNGLRNSGNYQQTFANQLWHIQRAMACGVNQIVFHGYSYEGFCDGAESENGYLKGTHWPGYSTMGYGEFSNNWSSYQPNWMHMRTYTDFLARNQWILRQGTARVDLAVYRHSYTELIDFNQAVKLYDDDGLLEQLGYTYEFICPAHLELPGMTVTDKKLDAEGPSYRAILFDNQAELPYEAVKQLIAYAQKELPILLIGIVPDKSAFHREPDIAPLMEELMRYPCVKRVASVEEVPKTLAALFITPRVGYQREAKLLNACRETEDALYFYFYHYGDASNYPAAAHMASVETLVTIEGEGVPYQFHTWTGEVTRLAAYECTAGKTTFRLRLGKNDSTVIALLHRRNPLSETSYHTGLLPEGEESWCDQAGQLFLKSTRSPLPEKKVLTDWTLILEKWSESSIPSESEKTTHVFSDLKHLVPWKELPGMEYASGIGTYKTDVSLEQGYEEGIGYLLALGKVCDSFSLKVNDLTIPVNQSNTQIDIGFYLRKGTNTIEVTVASTLLNALLEYEHRVKLKSFLGQYDCRQPDAYGICNDVLLIPYALTAL